MFLFFMLFLLGFSFCSFFMDRCISFHTIVSESMDTVYLCLLDFTYQFGGICTSFYGNCRLKQHQIFQNTARDCSVTELDDKIQKETNAAAQPDVVNNQTLDTKTSGTKEKTHLHNDYASINHSASRSTNSPKYVLDQCSAMVMTHKQTYFT